MIVPRPVFVHGAALSVSWQDRSASLTDMIFRTVSQALTVSGIDIGRIESVVLAAHDLVDGRSLSSMVTAPAAGAYLRDEIRLAEDGLAAVSLAAARIEAGETEFSIVAAWGRASEGDYAHTSRAAFDPFMVQPFALDEFDASAFRLSAWIQRHGLRHEARTRASAARSARSGRNPRAINQVTRPRLNAPLSFADGPQFADIAVAAILGRPEAAVRIAGLGHSVEASNVGERDLVRMQALREAAARACSDAGVKRHMIDLCQLAGPTLVDEALSLEALELAAPGEGFAAYASHDRFNPSGGSESGWCFPTGGLVNVVESWLQLTGQAGGVQLPGGPRHALATGLSPLGGQVAHAAILEAA